MACNKHVLPRECSLKKTNTNTPVKRTSRFVLIFLLLLAMVYGCSATRIMPIHLGRVSQTEFYTQFFKFVDKESQTQGVKNQDKSIPQERVEFFDKVFTQLIGNENWQNIKDLYGYGVVHSDFINGKIYIQGTVNLIIYIDPLDKNYFFIEGTGSYYLVQDKKQDKKAIMLSGDFHIPLEKHRLDEMDSGSILLNVDIYITRIPEQITYLNDVQLIYELFMDTRMKDKHVYSIDYKKDHKVYLIEDYSRSKPQKSDEIGFLKFHNDKGSVKLIDLRGINFLRNDYKPYLK